MEGQILLIDELKKHDLCRLFWSKQIEETLGRKITLDYEETGEMGVYSRYFDFIQPYVGNEEKLSDTYALMHLSITANRAEYDIKKAMEGVDFFHNVQIKVMRGDTAIVTCRFRLWSGIEDEYCGNKDSLQFILNRK